MTYRLSFLAIVLLFCAPTYAQVAFDVASIKENKELGTGGSMRITPDGGIRAMHISARALITIAYGLQGYQLIGAPNWLSDVYYDVNAKPQAKVTRDETFAMFQALIVERFKLAFHRETREVDGFGLVQAKTGMLGPDLKPSPIDCGAQPHSATPKCREGMITMSSMKVNGGSIWSLVNLLVGRLGAPVIDETKLTGAFDIDFRWSPDIVPTDDLPSIYTALQEQLGLKVERRRVPSEMFILDHIERPTPD